MQIRCQETITKAISSFQSKGGYFAVDADENVYISRIPNEKHVDSLWKLRKQVNKQNQRILKENYEEQSEIL